MDDNQPDEAPPDDANRLTIASREEAFAELADLNDEIVPAATGEADSGNADIGAGGGESGGGGTLTAPPVVVVMVTHNAGDWLDETLESLATQNYADLSILIIDAASDIDPTPQIAKVAPGAFVRRLEHNVGFGPTLNEVLSLVSGASFLCLCHDDVALDPDAIHKMVEEAFRSNAGVIGPKLVAWDDPEVILQVGVTVDKTGSRAPYAERGELDQEQHDAVRDVFTVPGACTLVRADLFAHLGGFDPAIDLFGEDLDLCWRAHLVGARVIVAPAARVRHRESMAQRRPEIDIPAVAAAHRLRTTLSCYSGFSLVKIVPQAIIIAMVEAILDLVGGRRREARAQFTAWTANLRNARSLHANRKRVGALREARDRDVRRLQAHSVARLLSLLQVYRRSGSDEQAATGDSSRSSLEPHRSRSLVPYGVAVVVVLLALGSRDLLFGSLPAMGEFAQAPHNAGSLWSQWVGGWNPVGLGSSSPVPTMSGVLGALGTLAFGSLGFVRRVGIVGLLPIGVWGAWRMARPLGSRRAQLAALVVYATVPVPYNALTQGRWGGLALYAVAPWLLAVLARTTGLAPFAPARVAVVNPDDAPQVDAPQVDATATVPAPEEREQSLFGRIFGLGLLLGVVGLAVPFVLVVAVALAVGLAVGSLLAGRLRGLGRLATVTLGAVVVAAVLQIPWTFGFFGHSAQWSSFAGIRSGVKGWLSFGRILRFESGTFGAAPLGYAFLLAGALPLVLGRGWRFAWALRAWGCATACWALLWAGQQGWFPLALPPAEVLLAPAAAALALAVGCGMAAFDIDLPGYKFGWRQGVSILAAAAVLVGAVPMLADAVGGRWSMATADLHQTLPFVDTQRAATPFRVLWLGDPDVVPPAGWPLDDQLDYATSNNAGAKLGELWSPSDPGSSHALATAVRLALDGQTTRLGSLLATMGVRYIVIPRQIVPSPFSAITHAIPERLTQALGNQLDFDKLPINSAFDIYQNEAWHSGATLYPAETPIGHSVASGLGRPAGTQVLTGLDLSTGRGGSGTVPAAGVVALGVAADRNWHLTVDGKSAKAVKIDGWQQGFVIPKPGRVRLEHRTPPMRWVLLVFQAVLWAAALVLWRQGTRRREPLVTDLIPDEPISFSAGSGPLVRLGATTVGRVDDAGRVTDVHEIVGTDADPLPGGLEPESAPEVDVAPESAPEADVVPETTAPEVDAKPESAPDGPEESA